MGTVVLLLCVLLLSMLGVVMVWGRPLLLLVLLLLVLLVVLLALVVLRGGVVLLVKLPLSAELGLLVLLVRQLLLRLQVGLLLWCMWRRAMLPRWAMLRRTGVHHPGLSRDLGAPRCRTVCRHRVRMLLPLRGGA
jgi:hypothetical protein